jgi:hypothetical protein
MANQLTVSKKQKAAGDSRIIKSFTCVLSGSYLNSGGLVGVAGEILNFNAALNPGLKERSKLPGVINGSLAALPANTDFTVAPLYGFTFVVERNAASPTPANYVLRIFSGATGVELASGTYAAVAALLVAAGATPIVISVSIPLKYN